MKSTAMIGVLFLLAACGSKTPRPDASEASAGGLGATTEAARPEPTADEAKRFIASKLEDVTRNGERLSFSNIDLTGPWLWTETTSSLSSSEGMSTGLTKTLAYNVDPAALRLPASVVENDSAWSVKFECSVKDCIHVNGDQVLTTVTVFDQEPSDDRTAITDPQSSNYWWFRDRNAAERVAKAINVLLRAQGASGSAF